VVSFQLRRSLFFVLGLVFTALGVVGVLLPLVPTTPFLLLAAACFARSSQRFYDMLLSNRVCGPYIEEWRRSRRVEPAAKRKAYLVVVLTFAISIAYVDALWIRALLLVLGLGLLVFLRRLPS
jgi:uncharacterized membrane protein YbaN (DUF454 family)